MRARYIIGLIIIACVISGCENGTDKKVTTTNIDITALNGKRAVTKNSQEFNNDEQGKRDLLMLMANSVDHYNLVSGTMNVTIGYQGDANKTKYVYQINVPEYTSYIYQTSSNSYDDQIIFRDSQKMYFFNGKQEDLDNHEISQLLSEQMMTVEDVSKYEGLFDYQDMSLEERVEDINISRVANDLFGDVAPYLFPEDISLRQLTMAFNNFNITGTEIYLERSAYKVEGKVNSDLYNNDSTLSILVDKETGIVLKYLRTTDVSKVEMAMGSIAVDQNDEENLYNKYIDYK